MFVGLMLAFLAILITACVLWPTDLVQSWVLRWIGHSYYVPTSWSHRHATARYARRTKPPALCAGGGSLVGSLSTGIRRSPARASAPAVPSVPGECAVGLNVGSGTPSDPAGVDTASLPFPPFCGQGRPQRTVAAGATPSLAAAVDQVGAS